MIRSLQLDRRAFLKGIGGTLVRPGAPLFLKIVDGPYAKRRRSKRIRFWHVASASVRLSTHIPTPVWYASSASVRLSTHIGTAGRSAQSARFGCPSSAAPPLPQRSRSAKLYCLNH